MCHLFPHLTFYTPNQSDLYLVNFLATVVREPDVYRLLTFHAPNLIPLFHCLGHTKGSVQAQGTYICFITRQVCIVRSCLHLTKSPSWRTTHCRLSTTAYSIYLHPSFILEAIPPSTTWGHTTHGDRDVLVTESNATLTKFIFPSLNNYLMIGCWSCAVTVKFNFEENRAINTAEWQWDTWSKQR